MEKGSVSKLLDEIVKDPDALEKRIGDIDRMLLDVVRIEKKHLYGLEQTSVQKRRQEITEYLTKQLK